jgi:hypothetical protein
MKAKSVFWGVDLGLEAIPLDYEYTCTPSLSRNQHLANQNLALQHYEIQVMHNGSNDQRMAGWICFVKLESEISIKQQNKGFFLT